MTDPGARANRLARESSPYLLLHAHNPVDWYPWGPEAIERARREDKPIFLSVGYSTCYWCHVMERESFSNPAIAGEMNAAFVNVKVDREERPDLDEIYMLATQILAGQGGWPNSLFLTPKLEPFFAGTYFPPEERWGRPGFATVVRSMVHAWSERRPDVEAQAGELAAAIRRHLAEAPAWRGELPGAELARQALAALRQRFDATWGGFGDAPKFPTPANLWLLDHLAGERPEAAMMLEATLGAMARGGLFDQLAGGFHRYATDREWRVPHFEKMLYDNGLLLEAYAREHARTGSAEAARVALETAEFLERELAGPEGAFHAAIDAETDGHEGAYYVWTRAELDAALGAEDAQFLAPLLGFAGDPFFEGERYVLHLPRPLEVLARERRTTRERLLEEMAPLRATLLEARARRKRPATDDKLLADWNGTAIAGLAAAGSALGRPALIARAARAADALLAHLRAPDGTLLHAWRRGAGRVAAFLSDYAFLIHGLLRLHETDGERRWLDEAVRLADEMTERLESPAGGFWNVAESDDLLVRGKEVFDGALPAANAVAALDLLDLAARTGEARFGERLERLLRAAAPAAVAHVDGARAFAVALALAAARRRERAPSASGEEEEKAKAEAEEGREKEEEKEAALKGVEGSSAGGRFAGGALAMLEEEARGVVRPELRVGPAGADGWRTFELRLELRDGWHLSSEGRAPLIVEGLAVELDGLEISVPPSLERDDASPRGGTGRPEATGRARPEASPERERKAIRLRFQACEAGRCLPEVAVDLPWPD